MLDPTPWRCCARLRLVYQSRIRSPLPTPAPPITRTTYQSHLRLKSGTLVVSPAKRWRWNPASLRTSHGPRLAYRGGALASSRHRRHDTCGSERAPHLLEILVHAARACVEQLADGGLRVGIAHVGGVLEVLHHLLLLARVVARVVVRAQPRALNHGEGPGLTSALDHLRTSPRSPQQHTRIEMKATLLPPYSGRKRAKRPFRSVHHSFEFARVANCEYC